MGKSSPEKREASPIFGRVLLRGCPAHFLLTAVAGILGGFLVAFILEFPSVGLWGGGILEHVRLRFLDIHDLASCAVQREEICRLHRFGTVYLFYVPCDDGIYVAPPFCRGGTPYETLFDMTLHSISGWLWYSLPPTLLCAGLAAVLWGGREAGTIGAVLRWLPFVFLCLETGYLFFYVFTQSTRLFPALTDLLCTAGYFILILLPILMKRGNQKC